MTHPFGKRKKLALAIGMACALGSAHGGTAAGFELSGLNGNNGFVLNGASAGDESGTSVSPAGDINGDGMDDLLVGAPYADTAAAYAGATYLVFGTDQGLPNPLPLSSINGTNGIVINGESVFDFAGASVSAAGDINGDSIDDLLIGAPSASPVVGYSGATYVVFGSDQGLPSPLSLSDLDGDNGFLIVGVNSYDESGASVSGAGDINGDGIADLIIGAPYAGAGAAYVVFGSDQGLPHPLSLSGLDGNNGFRIDGVNTGDSLGISVSSAGDVNGDGLDDLIVGAILAGTTGDYAGASYVVFGNDQGFTSPLDVDDLDGSGGFAIIGLNHEDELGNSVSSAGDINGDGIDDLLVGAPQAGSGGSKAGASYVVFGSDQALPHPLSVSDLNGSNGFVINGVSANDKSGTAVASAGNFNNDGFADIIIGAPLADPNGDDSGSGYVIYGKDAAWTSSLDLSSLDGDNGFVINGVGAGDTAGHSVSFAGDINADGKDDLVIGAPLADPNGASSGSSYVIFDAVVDDDVIFSNGFE